MRYEGSHGHGKQHHGNTNSSYRLRYTIGPGSNVHRFNSSNRRNYGQEVRSGYVAINEPTEVRDSAIRSMNGLIVEVTVTYQNHHGLLVDGVGSWFLIANNQPYSALNPITLDESDGSDTLSVVYALNDETVTGTVYFGVPATNFAVRYEDLGGVNRIDWIAHGG